MEKNWRNWCKFCGSSENTIKFECSAEVKEAFNISSSAHKICSECSSYLLNFQEFVEKSKQIDQLFLELSLENEMFLDIERINEIRSKFQLDLIGNDEFKEIEEIQVVEIKQEPKIEIVDVLDEITPTLKKRKYEKKKTKKPTSKPITEFNTAVQEKEIKKERNQDRIMITPCDEKFVPLICHVCNEDFSKISFNALKRHCKMNHDCEPSVPCLCGKTLSISFVYYRHRKKCIQVDRGMFECDLCGDVYQFKKYLELHMNLRHTITAIKKLICSECGKKFINNSALKRHVVLSHPAEPRGLDFHCEECPKRFDHISRLKAHVKIAHQIKTRDFICHICSKSYKLKKNLKTHLDTTHAKTKDFVCEINDCQKRFATIHLLRVHQECHRPRDLFCPHCDAAFKRPSILKNHIRYMHSHHAHLKPFECTHPSCELTFKTKTSAKIHYKGVHEPTYFDCPCCGASLLNRSSFLYHFKKSHPAEFIEWRIKNPAKLGRRTGDAPVNQ